MGGVVGMAAVAQNMICVRGETTTRRTMRRTMRSVYGRKGMRSAVRKCTVHAKQQKKYDAKVSYKGGKVEKSMENRMVTSVVPTVAMSLISTAAASHAETLNEFAYMATISSPILPLTYFGGLLATLAGTVAIYLFLVKIELI